MPILHSLLGGPGCIAVSLARSTTSLGRVLPQRISENAVKDCKSLTRFVRMESSDSTDSEKRCAIITGVSRTNGIGRTLVHQFIKQGYRVVGADLRDLEPCTSEGRSLDPAHKSREVLPQDSFHFVRADIRDPLQTKLIVEEAVQWFGSSIHVLVNNAAKTNPVLNEEDGMKDFADTIAVNLIGSYNLSQFVLPYMPAGRSSIIHISSTRAIQSEPNTEAYASSKAGLCGLTHAQAITLAGKVRVNAVLPGWINCDPVGEAALRPEDHEWHPVGRVGVPNDIAHLCLFLCDDERAGFITGQQFVVDGGVTKKMVLKTTGGGATAYTGDFRVEYQKHSW